MQGQEEALRALDALGRSPSKTMALRSSAANRVSRRRVREKTPASDGRLVVKVRNDDDDQEPSSPMSNLRPSSYTPDHSPAHEEEASASRRNSTRLKAHGLLSHLLQEEIEARSLKLKSGVKWRQDPDLKPDIGLSPKYGRRLLVVVHRLPFTILWHEESNSFDSERDPFEANFAELVAAEMTEDPSEVVMVGAPRVRRAGSRALVAIPESIQPELDRYLRMEHKVVPVFPPSGRDYFADSVLFPLLHYTTPSMETGLGLYDWEGYELTCQAFRDLVLKEWKQNDMVWIHDYSLMLLPKMLRKELPDIFIGFYMHCVFPSSEVYRVLPQREHLLRGVLSSNIVGFHNFQYVRHFLTACTRVLGLECTASGIEACPDALGTHTKVIAVSLGIDLAPYQSILACEETKARAKQIGDNFLKHKILVSRDRLEEMKGIPHKIMAFHKFLQKAPHWQGKCVLIQICEALDDAGSDEDAEDRQPLLQQVYQMAGEVNAKFGAIGYLPIHFLCQNYSRAELAALFMKATVFIDTPLRDTLSASAHEFLVCQEAKDCGVLIMSEFSGSAQSLRAAALCVNPWDTSGFADAIQEALEMDLADRLELQRYGHHHVVEHTLRHWAVNFMDEMLAAERECETERLQIPPLLTNDSAVSAMRKAKHRILVLGFSGTLLARSSKIHAKILPKLSSAVVGNLQVIAEDPDTHIIIISGLEHEIVGQAIGNVPCWIIAEAGVCYKRPHEEIWHSSIDNIDTEWIAPVKGIMEYFADRTPGSTVVETSSSVSWHYQQTQGDHAAIQSKDLLIHLWAGPLLSAPAEVVVGNDSVCVRPTGISKASQLEKILQKICENPESAGDLNPEWFSGDAVVMCISDLIPRDEEVFLTVQKFFEPDGEQRKAGLATSRFAALAAVEERSLSILDAPTWSQGLGDRGPQWASEICLEANSKSLGNVYSQLDLVKIKDSDSETAGPFGLFKARTSVPPSSTASTDQRVKIFTCTVGRKPTRARCHLSDTSDVAFLIARLALETRLVQHDRCSDAEGRQC